MPVSTVESLRKKKHFHGKLNFSNNLGEKQPTKDVAQ